MASKRVSIEVDMAKKRVVIDMQATWFEALPILLAGAKSRSKESQRLAHNELARMAEAADLYNAGLKKKEKKNGHQQTARPRKRRSHR